VTVSVCGLVLAAAPWLTVEGRVGAERAVERARYAFVLGATRPFDEAYPRGVFEHRVARERAEEEALKHAFGLEPTPQVLEKEYERIEKTTKDPDQWRAIKAALGDDRSRIQEVFCRPLVVSRALRARFAFDQAIHAEPHEQARKARALFIAGKSPPEARRIKMSLDADDELPDTEALLAAAKAEAGTGPRVLTPPSPPPVDAPETVSPEVRAVRAEQLRAPGDVTTILEERDQFEVLRLVDRAQYLLTVDVVRVAKRDFESWFEAVRSRP
jgi:hypothetical protein